ncbi:hypothetical protein PanWU01x14_340050 [Parasponia andersonii]|uniref:Uncharacterized protein n=1 Tax=Parasponia andersonii TaxID=3476 RepID=A0A2P5AEI8_PARAD|nr:hypothetical protein PanWU01x14_340050 [Parasponia andersonii]
MEEIVGLCKMLNISKKEEEVIGLDDSLLDAASADLKWALEIDVNVFIFRFDNIADKKRVLDLEPWNFSKAMLILKEFDNRESPGKDDFRFAKFWGVGRLLANQIGKCLEVETDRNGECYQRLTNKRHLRKNLKAIKMTWGRSTQQSNIISGA